jgi:hypothetical protein
LGWRGVIVFVRSIPILLRSLRLMEELKALVRLMGIIVVKVKTKESTKAMINVLRMTKANRG